MLTLSRYIVETPSFVDPDEGAERVIIFSTRTSRTLVLSPELWSLVQSGDFNGLDRATRSELEHARILVPSDEAELDVVLSENRSASDSYSTLYLVVQPTAACQLGCDYCGQTHVARHLIPSEQELFIDRARCKLQSGRFSSLELAWFGAEPLLGLDVIRAMTPRFQELASALDCGFHAKMVSNGLGLTIDVAEELAGKHSVRYVEITLDGDASGHDRRRVFKKGGPTFERILRNIIAVVTRRDINLKLGVRCNVDRRNRESVTPLLRRLADGGIHLLLDRFYFAPIHAWGNDAEKNSASPEEFAGWQMEWFAEMSRLGHEIGLLPQRTKLWVRSQNAVMWHYSLDCCSVDVCVILSSSGSLRMRLIPRLFRGLRSQILGD